MARLLIVHDDEDEREDIHKVAGKAGYGESEIVQAMNQQTALAAIDEYEFDAAVIDISLTPSGEDTLGLGVIETLRRRHPRCRIIGLTTFVRDYGVLAYDKGADDFIFTGWATINYVDLLRNKLADWRKARPRAYAIGC